MTRLVWVAVLAWAGCSADDEWECLLDGEPDFAQQIGCDADFDALSSDPPSASIPGARAAKTVIDRIQDDALFIQNSKKYPIHHAFVSAHLSGGDLPSVPLQGQFSQTEYSSPNRRFLLGSLTYYDGPQVWAYEIAPYDTATADMIETVYDRLRDNTFIGDELWFHPTSEPVEVEAANLPADVRVITTDELFEGIDYQPLNLGTSMGRLSFLRAVDLETGYVSFRDITVLDAVPNDIAVTAGIITEAFQTPLSHINVLSQNRGTPNMGLRNAFQNEQLRALEGKWVELTVGPFQYAIREVTQAEADQWWEDHRPDPLGIPDLDLSVTELTDIETVLDLETYDLAGALGKAIPAFGGKASHYGALVLMGDDVPAPKAFGIPVYYYRQFMEQNGFDDQVAALLADAQFQGDPAVRDARLAQLRDAMVATPLDPAFEQLVIDKLDAEYGIRVRFRSSTNAEDLDGFTGAGLYTSKSGDPNDPAYPVADAIRTVWASVWFFRAYEEREFRGIDHTAVGMALLVHRSFPDEEANGVALTANLFDRLCAEPGFYVNVQVFEESVVKPAPGVTTDQFIYHFDYPGQPVVWLSHSSLVPEGASVLTRAQTYELGKGLRAVHEYFAATYDTGDAPCDKFYAMDVEFKFDGEPGEIPTLYIKQARPHPGWGL